MLREEWLALLVVLVQLQEQEQEQQQQQQQHPRTFCEQLVLRQL